MITPMISSCDNEALRNIESIFQLYLKRYFFERNIEATLELLSPTITGFGTALDECVNGFDAAQRLFNRDIKQAPNPIECDFLTLDCSVIGPGLGIVRSMLDMRTIVHDQWLTLNNARMSMVVMKHTDTDRWLIEHLHISFPWQEHGENESFPVKELEDRMIVLERLVQDRTQELQEAHDLLRHQAETDMLTGLCNRMKANNVLEQELVRMNRYGVPLSIILLDLDFFKEINDHLGHKSGDIVLRGVAHLLAQGVRNIDTVARWGGEEFLVICPSTRLDAAVDLAERLRVMLANQDLGIQRKVSASFGVAEVCSKECHETLLERADKALYKAKHSGRNRVISDFTR